MRQIAISFWLGFLALPAFFFGVLPFDVNGQPTPLKGIVSGFAAVALCLAVCQFLVARSSGSEVDAGDAPPSGWLLLLAMLAPVVGMFCLAWLLDPQASETDRLPFMSAGIIGVLAGAALGKYSVKRRHAGMSR